MNTINRFLAWLRGLNAQRPIIRPEPEHVFQSAELLHFSSIFIVDKPPHNSEITAKSFYFVIVAQKPKWALFKCPCRCGDVVTLSLQQVHLPHWRLTRTLSGHPTLYPSIWRNKGCLSHFWVHDGRVLWCADSGTHPDTRRS